MHAIRTHVWEYRYSSTDSEHRYYTNVSGQLHAPTALTMGKEIRCLLNRGYYLLPAVTV